MEKLRDNLLETDTNGVEKMPDGEVQKKTDEKGNVEFFISVNGKKVTTGMLKLIQPVSFEDMTPQEKELQQQKFYKLGPVNSSMEKCGYGTKLIKSVSEFLAEQDSIASAQLWNTRLWKAFEENGWKKVGSGRILTYNVDISRNNKSRKAR